MTETFREKNNKFRENLFYLLGFFSPISTAAISILSMLFLISLLIDFRSLRGIFSLIKTNQVLISILLFFLLHIIGFAWLSVEPVNYFKSWIIFFIPLFMVGTRNISVEKGLYFFLFGCALISVLNLGYGYIFYDYRELLEGSWKYLTTTHIVLGPANAISFGIAFTMLFFSKFKSSKFYLLLVLMSIFTIGTFYLPGRTGYILFILVALFLIFYFYNTSLKRFLIACAVLTTILIAFWQTSPTLSHRAIETSTNFTNFESYQDSNKPSSLIERLNFAVNSLNIYFKNPILGYGTGSFKKTYEDLISDPNSMTDNPHNHHILILFQFGIPGMIIYFSIFWRQLVFARTNKSHERLKAVIYLTPLFFIATNFFDTYFWEHHMQMIFAYLVTLLYRNKIEIEDHKTL